MSDSTTVILVVVLVALLLAMAIGGIVSTTVLCLRKRGTPEEALEKGEQEEETVRGSKPRMQKTQRHRKHGGRQVGCKDLQATRTKINTQTGRGGKKSIPNNADFKERELVRNEAYIPAERVPGSTETVKNEAYTTTGRRGHLNMTRNEAYATAGNQGREDFDLVRNEAMGRAEITRARTEATRRDMELTRNEAYSQREDVGMELMKNEAYALAGRDMELARNEAYALREGEGIEMVNTRRGKMRLTRNEAYGTRVRPTREEVEAEYYNYYFMN